MAFNFSAANHRVTRYGAAAVAALLAVGTNHAASQPFSAHYPFMFLIAGVLFGAWFGGLRSKMCARNSLAIPTPLSLLSDIEMPNESGYDLLRQVRALPVEEGRRTPAAALTAYARGTDRTRALRAGFQMHIPKPVEPNELIAVVANLAAQREPNPAPGVRA